MDISKPLYAVVGMRAPACSVALRTKEYDVSSLDLPDVRAIRLKGIEGCAGEVIDLSKHGRPKVRPWGCHSNGPASRGRWMLADADARVLVRIPCMQYPAAFANVRAISDIRSLYPLILQPWAGRVRGRKAAQPILIRASPGTGKTWCVMQLLYFLARGVDAGAARRAMLREGLATRCRYLSSGCHHHASRVELTPYVVYVQKLARLLKGGEQGGEHSAYTSESDLVRLYMRHEHPPGATLSMLEQLFEQRALILLIDGVDEAASLKEVIEDYVTQQLVPAGHSVVVTSRPEGVRLRLYKRFVIMNLTPLSEEQQNNAIQMQLQGSEFYERLNKFSKIRKEHDRVYAMQAFPLEPDRTFLEQVCGYPRRLTLLTDPLRHSTAPTLLSPPPPAPLPPAPTRSHPLPPLSGPRLPVSG